MRDAEVRILQTRELIAVQSAISVLEKQVIEARERLFTLVRALEGQYAVQDTLTKIQDPSPREDERGPSI